MKTSSEFSRHRVLNGELLAGALLFVLGYAALYPSDLNAARFFVSRGRTAEAERIYGRLLADRRIHAAERLEVLGQVASLKRWSGDMPGYVAAVRTLALEGGAGTDALADALICARALDPAGTGGEAARDAAALFERILAGRDPR